MTLGRCDSRRGMRTIGAMVLAAACSLAIAQNHEPSGSVANVPTNLPASVPAPSSSSSASGSTKPAERLREGTRLIDVMGTFQSVGNDNVSFAPGGSKDSYRLLQNLNLERISRTLDENRGTRQGMVSGTITEFRGSNFVLVTKVTFPSQEGDAASGR